MPAGPALTAISPAQRFGHSGRSRPSRWVAAKAAHTSAVDRAVRRMTSAQNNLRIAQRNRKALVITDADEKLIASAAIIGESSQPVNGYNTPAASGTPSAL